MAPPASSGGARGGSGGGGFCSPANNTPGAAGNNNNAGWRRWWRHAVVAVAVVAVGAVAMHHWSRRGLVLLHLSEGERARLAAATQYSDCAGLDSSRGLYCVGVAVPHILDALLAELPRGAGAGNRCLAADFVRQWAGELRATPMRASARHALRQRDVVDWDVLQPFAVCPGERRLGYVGDGGKWTCLTLAGGLSAASSRGGECAAFSFGVRTDSSFEDALATHPALRCRVDEFDPSPDLTPPLPAVPDRVTFHPWGLRANDGPFSLLGASVPGFTLATLLQRVGRTHLQVLKVDIESSEWEVLWALLAAPGPLPFDQLLMELHFMDDVLDPWPVARLVAGMLAKGFVPFHKELNAYSPTSVTEVSFVSLPWLASVEPACAAPPAA